MCGLDRFPEPAVHRRNIRWPGLAHASHAAGAIGWETTAADTRPRGPSLMEVLTRESASRQLTRRGDATLVNRNFCIAIPGFAFVPRCFSSSRLLDD